MLRLGCKEKRELYDPTKDRGSTTLGTLNAENAMPDREAHQTDEIEVVDEEGNEYTVFEYQEVMEKRSMTGPSEWIKTGPRWFRLRNGNPVNQVDDNTFKIATTDKILKRVQ